jgi:hypothetical protein
VTRELVLPQKEQSIINIFKLDLDFFISLPDVFQRKKKAWIILMSSKLVLLRLEKGAVFPRANYDVVLS